MTKKHYIALAKTINSSLAVARNDGNSHTVNSIEVLAESIAQVCAADNNRFDSFRFLEACGIAENKVYKI